MCTIAPSVHCSGIGWPCVMLLMSSRRNALSYLDSALYTSHGIPSIPLALLFSVVQLLFVFHAFYMVALSILRLQEAGW